MKTLPPHLRTPALADPRAPDAGAPVVKKPGATPVASGQGAVPPFAPTTLAAGLRRAFSLPRSLVAPAAASLVGLLVGFQGGPRIGPASANLPNPTAAHTIAAQLPRQVGAPLSVLVLGPADFMGADPLMAAVGDARTRIMSLAATRPGTFQGIVRQVYAGRVGPEAMTRLHREAMSGAFPLPAQIRAVDPDVLAGADAAYSPKDGGRLFVSKAILTDRDRLMAAVTEELGHHLDVLLGPGDAVGDEGQLFRQALAQGRLLTQAELRSGLLDRDQRTIVVDGQELRVEYSVRGEDRAYEAAGSFSDADVRRGAEARLASQVEAEVVARAAAEDPTVKTLDAAKAHFEGAGKDLAAVKADAEAALVGADREAYLGTLGQALIQEAVTSSVVVRLKEGKVLPEDATLETALPPATQARVDQDDALSRQDPKLRTWGALVRALAGDVDTDGKLDFDALGLQRLLPDASAQDILRAIQTPLTATQMREKLAAVGFSNPIVDGFSVTSALELTPPKLFGLAGRTEVDKTQQQLLLRTGKVFVDSNEDGKIDSGDAVHFVDRDGTIKETTYGSLPEDLKKLVRLNMATAQVAEDYAALASYQRMRFPHYHADTGESDPEKVNEKFWSVSVAQANGGQVSWELKGDRPVRSVEDVQALLTSRGEEYAKVREAKREALAAGGQAVTEEALDLALIQDFKGQTVKGFRPSEAIADIFSGNGGVYTTECAHGRNLIRLQGLRKYYEAEFGAGVGTYKFDLLFAASPGDKARGEAYLKAFEAAGGTWEAYTQAHPLPDVAYGLEISRHRIFGKNEAVLEVHKSQAGGSAGGDTGYFHNYSVSVQGVKIGYVGENVIDLGYQDGVRRYWGHPGGVQTEQSWQGELASRRITVHDMSEFGQYFSHVDTKRGAQQVTRTRTQELERKIRDLRLDQPAGYEAQIEQLQGTIGWWKALEGTRLALVDHLDRAKLADAEAFFAGPVRLSDADDAKAILDLLTPAGQAAAAAAFGNLDSETRAQATRHFGVADEAGLSEAQRAQTALFATLTQYGQMHSYLKGEALGVVETERFLARQDWLTGQGHMASKANFEAWLKTEDFSQWYQKEAGQAWGHGADLAKLTTAQVQEVVELAFPMVKGKRTIYAEVNQGTELLAAQMAKLLKEGQLPNAEYRLDSRAVAPLQ
jgi:hypothetical protein